ncbi:UNVERIFIED_CONTAM: hypothetical protein ABIC26_000842 [Paenibacillus sp. PvR008]
MGKEWISPFVLCGGKIVTVNISAQQEFKLTAEAVKEKLTSRSRVLMLNYPNNPTGAIMTYEDWLPIVAYRERRDYFVKGLRERVVLSYAGGNVLRLSFHCRYRIKLRTVCTSVAKRNRSWSCSRVRVWGRRGGLCPLLLLSCS